MKKCARERSRSLIVRHPEGASVSARLARGEQEIAAGQGEDLDTVLAEADAILNRRDS